MQKIRIRQFYRPSLKLVLGWNRTKFAWISIFTLSLMVCIIKFHEFRSMDIQRSLVSTVSYEKQLSTGIETRNRLQSIYNTDKYGKVNEATAVILIQVHTRLDYLKVLINSLAVVKNIQNALLIFSHDVYSKEINKAIKQIDFTRVLQIFYPYSIQLHPGRFPGSSSKDCPRNITIQRAKQIKCENANHPDIHGHYRDATLTQAKHHWWWEINFVFNRVTILKNHSRVILFLEEDTYVSPDLLWTMKPMEAAMQDNQCGGCDLLDLGKLSSPTADIVNLGLKQSSEAITITDASTFGFALNRTLWTEIEKCANVYCEYDDYKWDYSLKFLFYTCFPRPVKTLHTTFPRIYRNRKCDGLQRSKNVKTKNCDSDPYKFGTEMNTTLAYINEQNLLFPKKLHLLNELWSHNTSSQQTLKRHGGWADTRDKDLCLLSSKLVSHEHDNDN